MSNFEGKYANVLTIILVIVIIAIIVLLGILGFKVLRDKKVDDDAQQAISEFDKKVNTNKKTNTTNTVDNTSNSSLDDILNQLDSDENQSGDEGQSSGTIQKTYLSGYEVIGKINIPKTGVNLPILAKVTPDSLSASVAFLHGVGLNKPGNTTILGHNYRNGKFFSNNYKLSNGDRIIITDSTGTAITYIIYEMFETIPEDAEYMLRDTEGYREISLSTCNDDSSMRLVILAREQV